MLTKCNSGLVWDESPIRHSVMEHPDQILRRLTDFLDHLIQEHGDYLFIGFVYLGFAVIIWILVRRRRTPVVPVSVVILPLGAPPKRDPEPEHSPFDDPLQR